MQTHHRFLPLPVQTQTFRSGARLRHPAIGQTLFERFLFPSFLLPKMDQWQALRKGLSSSGYVPGILSVSFGFLLFEGFLDLYLVHIITTFYPQQACNMV